jgi:transposase
MAATTMPNTMRMTNPGRPVREVLEVTGGVDTHADTHTAAALDQVGGLLGTATFPATPAGYQDLAGWLAGFGPLGRVGVEGTGSYGAGLSRWLAAAEITVLEVNRPDRSDRRRRGKSDPIDAINAARAVLAGTATATPKSRDGIVEAIRVLHLTREGAVKARTAARNQFTNLLVTAPETVKARLAGLTTHQQLDAAAAFRPGDISDSNEATKTALRTLARRVTTLTVEIDQLYTALADLTTQAAPELRAEYGVGPESAAQLLITAGDNADRLASEAAFAALCGTSPVPASSGRTDRHRLSRGGDRQANRALHMVILTRIRRHQPTRDYLARAITEGRTNKEATRMLKRYLARHLYRLLNTPGTITATSLAGT